MGAVGVFVKAQGFAEAIQGCLMYPEEDEKKTATDTTTVTPTAVGDPAAGPSNWDKFTGMLTKVVEFICLAKDTVEAFFSDGRRLFLRRQRRLFNQGKRMMRVTWWKWIETAVNAVSKVTSWVTNAGTALFNKAKALGNKFADIVVDGIQLAKATAAQIGEWTKKQLKAIFAPVGEFFDTIKSNFIGIFKGGYWKTFTNLVTCVNAVGSVVNKGVKDFFLPFLSIPANITKLIALDPVTWIKFIVNMICGWEKLKNAWTALKTGWKATDPKVKWNNYGQFVGNIAAFVVGALSRRRHY
jgi:hypothetical protein